MTPVLFATASAFWFGIVPEAHEAGWTGPVLLDTAARGALEMKSRSGRTAAGTVSDVSVYCSFAQTVALDNLVVAWALLNKPDVAWQMFVINSQAYALTLALNSVTKRVAARERPFGERCGSDEAEFNCDTSDRFQSFYSGHTAIAATSAGLGCAHHAQLDLYGNPYADAAACVAGVTLTLTTGMLRISSENHWASDVLVGGFMGFVSGYVLPTLVYYRQFEARPQRHAPEGEPRVAIVPLATPNSVQVAAVGMF